MNDPFNSTEPAEPSRGSDSSARSNSPVTGDADASLASKAIAAEQAPEAESPEAEAPPIVQVSASQPTVADGPWSGGFAAAICRPPSPRVWSALLVGALALPLGLAISGVAAIIVIGVKGGESALLNRAEFTRRADELSMTPGGLAAMVIPGQVVFLGLAVGAALLSPEGLRQRLRLVRGRMPVWTWPILAMATPAIGFATSIVLGAWVSEPSDHARELERMLREYDSRLLPMLFLLVAALPGLAEELLYRGYLQSRLLRAWPARIAILLSAVMFGIAHIDPFHALTVIPLGIWLGIVSWKADSLGPAILGHMTNNGLALLLARGVDRGSTPPVVPPSLAFAVFVAFASLMISLPLLALAGRPNPRQLSQT
jgi:membrane protease YdiL (CAAX protease family)